MLKWLKKNIITLISVVIVISGLLIFKVWVSVDPGKTIFNMALSKLPFIELVYKVVTKITNGMLLFENFKSTSIIIDFIKLFLTVPLKALLMFMLSKILLVIPIDKIFKSAPVGLNPSGLRSFMIDEQESFMASPSYKFRQLFVESIITVICLFVTSNIIDSFKQNINSFLSTNLGTITGIITLIILFVIYSVIYAIIDKQTLSFAVIKTMVFNVIPEIINNYCTTSLYIICYFMMNIYGISIKFFVALLILIVWLILKDFLLKKIKVSAIGYNKYFDFKASSIIAAIFVWTAYIIVAQMIPLVNDTNVKIMLESKIGKVFFNIFSLPFYELISSNNGIFEQINLTDDVFISELLKFFIFSLSASLIERMFEFKKPEFSKKKIIIWFVVTTCLESSLMIILYSLITYISSVSGNNVLFIIFIVFLALIINIVSNYIQKSSSKTFALTNILLESMIISAISILFVYFTDQVLDKILFIEINNKNINEVVVSAACIIMTTLYIIWFVVDYLSKKIGNSA